MRVVPRIIVTPPDFLEPHATEKVDDTRTGPPSAAFQVPAETEPQESQSIQPPAEATVAPKSEDRAAGEIIEPKETSYKTADEVKEPQSFQKASTAGHSEDDILPKSYTISNVVRTEPSPRAEGRVAAIWRGKNGQEDICIKVFRKHDNKKQAKITRAFYDHIVRYDWKDIHHDNVLPFLGVSDVLPPFCFVSPWMPNGNILEYIKNHNGVNRLHLLADAARGLSYLHSLDIVHGGIHPRNILISQKAKACIGDFGIARIIDDPLVRQQCTKTCRRGVVRYMAPEQVDSSIASNGVDKPTDVYCFAMTAYEVLTGTEPHSGATADGNLVVLIAKGCRPTRPKERDVAKWLSDGIWNMMESCWILQPSLRPPIDDVYKTLQTPENKQPSGVTMNLSRPKTKPEGNCVGQAPPSKGFEQKGRNFDGAEPRGDTSEDGGPMDWIFRNLCCCLPLQATHARRLADQGRAKDGARGFVGTDKEGDNTVATR